MNPKIIRIDWTPQPRQLRCIKACGLSKPFDNEEYHKAVADIIGYGGAAGGGKTDCNLATAVLAATAYPKINIGYFRREYPTLEGPGGAIQRSRELIGHFAKYNEQKKRWIFPNGSILQFCHCATPSDVYNYQSQQFDILIIDEVTQFEKEMVKYLLTRNRATIDTTTFAPFALFSTNPGNVGHQYFKDEFVTLGPWEAVNSFINESGDSERHLFIPSKLTDNQILVNRDPGYAKRIGSTELNRKMLLEGDWDVFAGQAFNELSRDKHIIEDLPIQPHWRLFASYDHGFNHPFSFGIFAINDDGEIYRVAEAKDRLKRVDEIARIMEQTAAKVGGLHRIDYIVAGHDCWARGRDGGPTIAEQFFKTPQQINLRKANIDRVQGVNQVRAFIAWRGKGVDGADGVPKFFFYKSACSSYDTLARMIFDTNGANPEDVLKMDADENGYGGDDQYDEVRYGLMSRPKPNALKPKPINPNSVLGYIQRKKREEWLRREYVGY